MKNIFLLLFCSACFANAQAPPPPALPPPGIAARPAQPPPPLAAMAKPSVQWGGLLSIQIPRTCKHPRTMRDQPTCRVFLAFKPGAVPPGHPLFFRTWDDAGEEDSVYRILLSSPSWRGIFVQGVCGHRVFVEVTYR